MTDSDTDPQLAAAGAEVYAACHRLVIAYTHLVDEGRAGEVADLFTEDGIWQLGDLRVVGREEIRSVFSAAQAGGGRSRHVCTNFGLDLMGTDEAEGLTYVTLYRAQSDVGGSPTDKPLEVDGPAGIGVYRDRFRHTSDGWRIASRITEIDFVTKRH